MAFGLSFAAQAAPPEISPRVLGVSANDADRVVLGGNAHSFQVKSLQPSLHSPADLGAVEDSLPAGRMLLMLQRSAAQEEALRDYIQATHTPGDPAFHQWLKPDEFGRLYGPADRTWPPSPPGSSHTASPSTRFTPGGWRSSSPVPRARSAKPSTRDSPLSGQRRGAPGHRQRPSVPAALPRSLPALAPVNDFQPQPQSQGAGPRAVRRQDPPSHAPMDLP